MPAAPPARALGALLRDAARLDRTQSDPVVALRNAIGVVVPLALGIVAGAPVSGLAATIGALQTCFADRPGPYRLRLIRMTLTAAAAAGTAGLAVRLSGSDVASTLFLTGIAFLAGLLLAGGPAATQVGIAGTAAALIIGHQVPEPAAALHVAGLVLLGGLLQTVLALLAWPLGRHGPERRALAGLYRGLAGVARHPSSSGDAPPLSEQLTAVRAVFDGVGHDHGPSVEAYRVLLDQAERIRRQVIALGGYAHRFERLDLDDRARALRAVLVAIAPVLDEIAAALEHARPIDRSTFAGVREQVTRTSAEMTAAAEATGTAPMTLRAAASAVSSLGGQLRAAVETTEPGGSEGRAEPGRFRVPGQDRLRDPLASIRANLTLDSPVLRHAVRLAVVVGGSDLVTRLADVNRGYWVALTALVVLRPDFAATFQRSVMRVLGTLVGLLLATALLHVLPTGTWYAVVLVGVFLFGMRLAGPANVALSAVSLSALVVALLAIGGVPAREVLGLRSGDTVAGGLLALVAVLAWPVWERGLVSARLASLLDAYRDNLTAVADLTEDATRLRRVRNAARLARTAAQASVDRARAEPVRAGREVELGESVLANSHRLIHAVIAIDALRPALRAAGGDQPELAVLLQGAIGSLRWCSDLLRHRPLPKGDVRMRPLQEALFAAIRSDPDRFGGPEAAAVLAEASDRLANSVDTLVGELRRSRGGLVTAGADPARPA